MVRVFCGPVIRVDFGDSLVIVVPEMKLSPNVGSDRSWVWNVVADVSEGEPEALTLAIRFANSDNANQFKDAFIKAQKENEDVFKQAVEAGETKEAEEEKKEETA
jgi:Ran-binding protein 1